LDLVAFGRFSEMGSADEEVGKVDDDISSAAKPDMAASWRINGRNRDFAEEKRERIEDHED
jgi:hypothetical protein